MLDFINTYNLSQDKINMGKKLIKLMAEHKISEVEFEKEVAVMCSDALDELRPLKEPTKPIEYEEFMAMGNLEKSKYRKEFLKNESVQQYIVKKEFRDNQNKVNLDWCNHLANVYQKHGYDDLASICRQIAVLHGGEPPVKTWEELGI